MAAGGGTARGWRRPAAALAAIALAAAGLGWWGRAAVPPAAVTATAPPPDATTTTDPAPAGRDPTNTVVGYVKPPAVKMAAPIGAGAAADYRRRARYPRSARPLAADEADPIVRDREISPVESRGPNGSEPTLTVFPAAMGFEAPEPAVVYARVTMRGKPFGAREIQGTLTDETLVPIADVPFHDDGADGDAVAGDGTWTAVVPGERLGAELATSYLMQVRAVVATDEERRAATSFLYASPHAQLTGRYRDVVVDGSLVVGAEVEVTQAGRFYLEATLYAADGAGKLAWAQTAGWLEPGTHWLDLSYYGLILRERGVDGPYVLGRVALSTTTGMPNAMNRVVENAYTTGAHPAGAFTDRSFDDPDLLEAARRLEEDPLPTGLDAGG